MQHRIHSTLNRTEHTRWPTWATNSTVTTASCSPSSPVRAFVLVRCKFAAAPKFCDSCYVWCTPAIYGCTPAMYGCTPASLFESPLCKYRHIFGNLQALQVNACSLTEASIQREAQAPTQSVVETVLTLLSTRTPSNTKYDLNAAPEESVFLPPPCLYCSKGIKHRPNATHGSTSSS